MFFVETNLKSFDEVGTLSTSTNYGIRDCKGERQAPQPVGLGRQDCHHSTGRPTKARCPSTLVVTQTTNINNAYGGRAAKAKENATRGVSSEATGKTRALSATALAAGA